MAPPHAYPALQVGLHEVDEANDEPQGVNVIAAVFAGVVQGAGLHEPEMAPHVGPELHVAESVPA